MLKVETSLIDGEAPVVIRSRNDANSILTAFGKSRNNDENLGRFGTEQVVLVRDNLATCSVAGKQVLVLTILEFMGLEFQVVVTRAWLMLLFFYCKNNFSMVSFW